MKLSMITLITVALLVFSGSPAFACEGFGCNLFGWTDRAKIQAEADQKQAELQSQRYLEVTRIQAEADARVAEANAQLQHEVELGKLNQEQARQQSEQFQVAVQAAVEKQVREMELHYDTVQHALSDQTNIALEGVRQAGQTSRSRIAWDSSYNIVAVVLVAAIVLYYMRSRRPMVQPPTLLQTWPERTQLPAQPTAAFYIPANTKTINNDRGDA